jgi:hypothetical protein
MAPRPADLDPRFAAWLARVDELVRERLGILLSDIPGLPLMAGFDAGDTPAEFYAGCIDERISGHSLLPPG